LFVTRSSLFDGKVAPVATFTYDRLTVYQVAEELCDLTWEVARGWDSLSRDTADSIGANIAEGSGRGSFADNRRHVRIARGSFYEARFWLRRANRRELLTPAQVARLQPLVERLGPLLNGYLRSLGRATQGTTVEERVTNYE
jgi:four helix bundle protein